MEFASILLRVAHIACVAILVGGLIYQRIVLIPSEQALESDARDQLRRHLQSRWSRWVMFSIGILLISGLANFALTLGSFKEPFAEAPALYHMLFGIKFLVAMALFMLTSMLAGKRESSKRIRQQPKKWLNVALVMALVIIAISGYLRSTHNNPPMAESMEQNDA